MKLHVDQWGYNLYKFYKWSHRYAICPILITARAGPPGGDKRKPPLTMFQLVLRVVVVLGLVVVIEVGGTTQVLLGEHHKQ